MSARKKKAAKKPAYTKLDFYQRLKYHINEIDKQLLQIPFLVDTVTRLDPKYLTENEKTESKAAVDYIIANAPLVKEKRDSVVSHFNTVVETRPKFDMDFSEPMHEMMEFMELFGEHIITPVSYLVVLIDKIPKEEESVNV